MHDDGMSDAMSSHATLIKQAARDLAQGNIWATDRHIETIDHHAGALATELDEARELANTYSAALSMVEDCLADAAGDDTSINDIRQSLGLPARDDMLPAPGDTAN